MRIIETDPARDAARGRLPRPAHGRADHRRARGVRPAERADGALPPGSRNAAAAIHLIADIPGLRELEFPRPEPGQRVEVDLDAADLPSGAAVEVDVFVEDRLRRFLPTVLQLVAPQRGIATALDALAGCASLAWSIPDDTPMFLMSSPQRSIPPTTAVVRACLRDHATMAPAAHAVLVVDTPAGRNFGVADATGHVVVAFAYPAFAVMPVASPPEGSHGIPTADQHWPVDVSVRWEPDALSFPSGVEIPRVHSVLCQQPGTVSPPTPAPATRPSPPTSGTASPLVLGTAAHRPRPGRRTCSWSPPRDQPPRRPPTRSTRDPNHEGGAVMPEYLAPGVYVEETTFRQKTHRGREHQHRRLRRPDPLRPDVRRARAAHQLPRLRADLRRHRPARRTTASPVDNDLAHAVRGFFENGGRRLYVARTFVHRTEPADRTDAGRATRSSIPTSACSS